MPPPPSSSSPDVPSQVTIRANNAFSALSDDAEILLANLTVADSKTSTTKSGDRRPQPSNSSRRSSTSSGMGGYTDSYLLSFNPCLDFFFHVVPDMPSQSLIKWLEAAWDFDPLTTLKLICNLRGVRGSGKSDKEGFFWAAFWLFQSHPKTLASNVGSIADFGCFKDLPELLFRLLNSFKVRQIRKQKLTSQKKLNSSKKIRRRRSDKTKEEEQVMIKAVRQRRSAIPRQVRVQKANARSMQQKKDARALRKKKHAEMAENMVQRYDSDWKFKKLYSAISRHFAECLKSDLEFLKSKKLNKISMAAQWCPSLDSSYDRSTLLCEAIARHLFPRKECPEYKWISDAHYAYRIRDRLRKEVLVPLRKALKLDEEKITTEGPLLPHQIIAPFLCGEEEDNNKIEAAEVQWNRMVQEMQKAGKLDSCIAVCKGPPSMMMMKVSVAMGIMVSELSREPWNGKVITFSEEPKLQLIEGDDLKSKAAGLVQSMEWGYNINFQKVFDLILDEAKRSNSEFGQMVKRVFVFSDVEFDEASVNPWEKDYKAIVRKFNKAGFGSEVPHLVFWNLRNLWSVPVVWNQAGMTIVSGFSNNFMRVFLKHKNGAANPASYMTDALSGEEYKKLVVVD